MAYLTKRLICKLDDVPMERRGQCAGKGGGSARPGCSQQHHSPQSTGSSSGRGSEQVQSQSSSPQESRQQVPLARIRDMINNQSEGRQQIDDVPFNDYYPGQHETFILPDDYLLNRDPSGSLRAVQRRPGGTTSSPHFSSPSTPSSALRKSNLSP